MPSRSSKPPERTVVVPDFELNGAGENVDSIAFWEGEAPEQTLMFVTAKGNQLVEVWQYPFLNNELPPLTHDSFGTNAQVNGVVVDQATDQLYIAVSDPVSTVSHFALPEGSYGGEWLSGVHNLDDEPNLALLKMRDGQKWLYVSSQDTVYIYNAATGAFVTQFQPDVGLETMAADDYHQLIYIPDENGRTGVYVYHPDGSPHLKNGSHNFGNGQFDSDAEGILIYTCPTASGEDSGRGFIVVADQIEGQTEFEVFDRESWNHLAVLTITGVSYTDGIASTQQALPGYPLGIFAAINNDTTTVGVGWDKVLNASGLSCTSPPVGTFRQFIPVIMQAAR